MKSSEKEDVRLIREAFCVVDPTGVDQLPSISGVAQNLLSGIIFSIGSGSRLK